MKHKITVQFSILLSTLFAFLTFGNVFAVRPVISFSSTNVDIGVNKSERIDVDTTDFNGDISVYSSDNSVASARLLNCDSPSSCAVRNKSSIIIVQGVSSGSAIVTVSFTGYISSQGARINETQNINITIQNNDPALSSLQVSPGSISFDKNTYEYTVTLEHDVETIEVSATAANSTTTISGIGKYSLRDYLNTITVTTTAETGANTSYVIKVKRKDSTGRTAASTKEGGGNSKKSNDNKLADILIPGYDIKLEDGVTDYEITVKPDTETLMMRAIPNNTKAKVEIHGNDSIDFGENIVKIIVIAENGETKEYTVKVTRPSSSEGALVTKNSSEGNPGVLGATANGKGFNILPIILTVAGVFIAAGAVTAAIFLKKKEIKHKQFNVMRVNNSFRPGSVR